MEETVLIHALSNVGVPAALCFYTLFCVNRNIEKLTDAINRWEASLDRRISDLESDVKELLKKGR